MISAILAGGENRRFPNLKGFIEVEGSPIIVRTLALLRKVSEQVVISTNHPERYFHLGAPMAGDVIKDSGPMGGIVSLFLATGANELFVSACDMPFIHIDIIKYIIKSRSGQATVPVIGGKPEPLLAVYTREAAGVMERDLRSGQRSLQRMFNELDVTYIDEDRLRPIDPSGRSFVNINTPEDYERVFGSRAAPLT
jgi:molybdopterin-guanine dinucleotide biosynthesis protein A